MASRDKQLRILKKKSVIALQKESARRKELEIIQINLGSRCNQHCAHCHISGSPGGSCMNSWTAQRIIDKLAEIPVQRIEFTGGAPELNSSLPVFIQRLSPEQRTITVRTNLTVLALPEHAELFDLYQKHNVQLVASLPCYLRENVDRQRGQGVLTRAFLC